MKALLAGGVFDDEGGRASGYARKLFAAMEEAWAPGEAGSINGGSFERLEKLAGQAGALQALVWMADVPNDKPKLVNQLRSRAPSLKLVISKNNRAGKYSASQLAERLQRAEATALVEFTDAEDGRVVAKIWGPGQKTLLERAESPAELGRALAAMLTSGARAT